MILLDAGLLTINGTLIAQLLVFLAMLFVLSRVAWGPLVRMLEARRARIQEGIEATDRAKRDREAAENEYRAKLDEARGEAQKMVEQAQKMGESLRQELEVKAKERAEQIIAQAKKEIGQERERAVQGLRAQVADLAVLAAGRVIGETLDSPKHRQLIDRAIEEAELHA
ncbi:MAG TPA: F0F1 ATP synthase subunit B [Candidatus Dormibacteraeota bacterium]